MKCSHHFSQLYRKKWNHLDVNNCIKEVQLHVFIDFLGTFFNLLKINPFLDARASTYSTQTHPKYIQNCTVTICISQSRKFLHGSWRIWSLVHTFYIKDLCLTNWVSVPGFYHNQCISQLLFFYLAFTVDNYLKHLTVITVTSYFY